MGVNVNFYFFNHQHTHSGFFYSYEIEIFLQWQHVYKENNKRSLIFTSFYNASSILFSQNGRGFVYFFKNQIFYMVRRIRSANPGNTSKTRNTHITAINFHIWLNKSIYLLLSTGFIDWQSITISWVYPCLNLF